MRFEAFGKWLKSQRLARGIRSAAVLSKRAGLSTNYVSILERGEFRPSADTVERLAKAMGMSPTEHMDFLRRATLAGEPESVQAALTAAPFPGVVLWKHLPHALARVPYRCGGFVFASPDHVLVKVIPAAGALLAWAELTQRGPSKAQCRTIRRLVEEAVQKENHNCCTLTTMEREVRARWVTPATIASAVVPNAWRSLIFATEKATATSVARLKSWEYNMGVTPIEPAVLRFSFKDDRAQKRLGVGGAQADIIACVHDALTLDSLWVAADLYEQLKAPPDFTIFHSAGLPTLLNAILTIDADVVRSTAATVGAQPQTPVEATTELFYWARLIPMVHLILRLRDHPRVAEALLGHEWQRLLADSGNRAVHIEQLLREALQRSNPADA